MKNYPILLILVVAVLFYAIGFQQGQVLTKECGVAKARWYSFHCVK